ncbi:hypothetical protein R6Q59_024799 [Mikania micrantha]
MPVGNNSEDDFVPIRPEYTMVDRILARRQDDEEKEYYVKRVGLSYDECYWESESDISSFQQQIENFNRLQSRYRKLRKQKSNIRDAIDSKNKLKEFQQFEKSPEFLPGGELHPYQLEGLNFLRFSWSKQTHVILADEMGLGKMIQSIAFLASLYEENVSPHLVVAPLSTLRNLEREFATWAPHMNVNNLDELFMLMHFFDAGKFASLEEFQKSLRISIKKSSIPTVEAEKLQGSSLSLMGDQLALALGSHVSRLPELARRAEFFEKELQCLGAKHQATHSELLQARLEEEKDKITFLLSLPNLGFARRSNKRPKATGLLG